MAVAVPPSNQGAYAVAHRHPLTGIISLKRVAWTTFNSKVSSAYTLSCGGHDSNDAWATYCSFVFDMILFSRPFLLSICALLFSILFSYLWVLYLSDFSLISHELMLCVLNCFSFGEVFEFKIGPNLILSNWIKTNLVCCGLIVISTELVFYVTNKVTKRDDIRS